MQVAVQVDVHSQIAALSHVQVKNYGIIFKNYLSTVTAPFDTATEFFGSGQVENQD